MLLSHDGDLDGAIDHLRAAAAIDPQERRVSSMLESLKAQKHRQQQNAR